MAYQPQEILLRSSAPVTIDEDKCIADKGCTVCVDVCPLDLLAIDYRKGKAKVRSYGRIEHALTERQSVQKQGKNLRVIYAQDANSGIKLLAEQAWFATDKQGKLHAFLQPAAARQFAEQQQGKVVDYAGAEALVAH